MEPLTDNIMLKRKASKKALTDVRENVDHPSQQKPSSKTPKMKGLFGKSKQKGEQQPKKKVTKPDPITNSIRNPSNQHDLYESIPEKKAIPLGTSPAYEDSNDSDFLLNKPASTGISEEPSRAQPSADPVKKPAGKLSDLDLPPVTVTHSIPISSVFPPFENHRSDSCTEYSPALLDNPSSWDQITSPVCQLEQVPAISHSWEQCKNSPQFDQAISNSYESHSVLHKGQFEFSTISDGPLPGTTLPSEDFTNIDNPLSPPGEFSSNRRKESHPVKDPSIISESEFQSFISYFSTLDPQDGLLFGEQARTFFLRSELPNEELSRIWQLSDIDNDLKLTFREFCIAMKLVRNRKKGVPLPQTVPPSIFSSLAQLIESQDTPLTDQYIFSAPEQMEDDISSLEDYARTEVTSLPAEHPLPDDDVIYPTEEVCPLPETDSCSLDDRELEETVTVESVELPPPEDIEDPIPKLSNSSGTTDYANQIKGLFTPTPNPLPPPPTKTEMKQRSVLTPIVPTIELTPRVEVTPAVQMRSHTVSSLTSSHTEDLSEFLEGEDNPALLSLHGRGGTDPADMKKKNKGRRRPDRISAVILIDKTDNEDPQVSLINNGEVRTIELTPSSLEDRTPTFYDELDHMQDVLNHNKEKTNDESTPQSSPGTSRVKAISHKKDSKIFLLKKKFMPRSKKSMGSNLSLDKADTPLETAPRKKSKGKKSNKKGKKHKRSNSLDLNITNPRMYGSQNDIHIGQDKLHAPVAAMMEQSSLFPQHKAGSTLSLSPTHNQRDTQNDSDSFDSAGSSENLHSDSELSPRMRTKRKHKHNRSISSPECILSTPPIPEPSSDRLDYSYTPQTDLDDNKTPQHEYAVETFATNERELLNQRIHETFARCESLKTVNNQLLSQLNDIRLQKEELKVQFRYYQPPHKFI